MKKLILFISLFGLFILASCDDEPITVSTPSSSQTNESNQHDDESNSNITESKESNDNSSSDESNVTEPSSNQIIDSTSSEDDKTDDTSLPEYDDGEDWKGTIF